MEDEKGFVIKDRRAFDEKGSRREEKPAQTEKEKPPRDDSRPAEEPSPPLPEVNFNSLIFSLSSSALLHLGEIADPQSGAKTRDLPLAKHAIDTIAMLKEKTQGNLTSEESSFLTGVLTDLRWRFVRAAS
jgi:hypothetical protein